MQFAARVALFVFAAAGLSAADEPGAPLAESKRELQQLQKDQAAQKSGAGQSDLKGALPKLNAPTPGGSALNLPFAPPQMSNESDGQKKKDAAKNWLLDGMDRLERKSGKLTPGTAKKSGFDEEEAEDGLAASPAGPSSLLQIYAKQGKTDGTTKQNSPTVADPLAPFLQHWLAGSPVRGPVLDALARREPANSPGSYLKLGVPGFEAPTGPSSSGPGDPLDSSPASATVNSRGLENPYLQTLALAAPASTPAGGGPVAAPVRAAASSPVIAPSQTAPAVAPDNRASSKPSPFTPPPSKADEDKKYFPQLKRF